MLYSVILLALTFLTLLAAADNLNGRGMISVHRYPETGQDAPNNPPFCGMPWHTLDLNRITAVQNLAQNQCGTCLKICGSVDCITMLAVDRGGRNLDMSTGVSKRIIGTDDGIAWASWTPVEGRWCFGIHKKRDSVVYTNGA